MSIFGNFFKAFTTKNQHLINFLFGANFGNQMDCAKCAKQEQLFFYEGLRPIAASIKEGPPVLRLTIVFECPKRYNYD